MQPHRTAMTWRFVSTLFLTAVLALAFAQTSFGDENSAFDRVLADYESVRAALALDTTDGVATAARSIDATLAGLTEQWSAQAAGIDAAAADDVRALLPELRSAATALASAASLGSARDAFYRLSKPLVRWRQAVTGDKPVVAYCSMSKRSWLQESKALGNPYYGQAMLTCGDVVDS